ncbi:hypothetical protein Hanom_Chr05g00422741 [Helianthus anomalus]
MAFYVRLAYESLKQISNTIGPIEIELGFALDVALALSPEVHAHALAPVLEDLALALSLSFYVESIQYTSSKRRLYLLLLLIATDTLVP